MSTPAKGLEGIIAAQTAISLIDGLNGHLFYRGIDVNDLAEQSTFEETTALLWYGKLPSAAQLASIQRKFALNRQIPNEVISVMMALPKHTKVMDVLRTCVSVLASYDPQVLDNSLDANLNKAVRLTAALPTITAAWERIRNGLWPIAPSADLGHAANFLYMLTGKEPSTTAARVLDIALILHADHGLNASTFAARVTASTLSDMHSAIVSAIGTLKGSLHGGANELVMRMLEEISELDRVDEYLQAAFATKRKIMGFGHRIYKADDPRAPWLQRLAKDLAESTGNMRWYEMSERIRKIVQSERSLPVNVDFYSASVYYTLGIPIDLFTPIFAMSRIAGWTAHVYEQYSNNRLIRPEAEYTGPLGVPYTPLAERA
ncbi:citrate synthase [Oscillochloris sp. ZM17-4]|uniref:citrate synthase n=1 Tax=Oscillochloris sp. ZM17-4 TaxID=2866714 RepID=UPI001C73B234|nr:citrate synthase [Oscillochloris sp. ZM17-4]MBX0327565.1 citrate synthase [Oscillochloris sp. ZM17-4]